ncbi:MAG: hypothetical protein HXS48_04690 [Theionarchaea archaeon]|nr:hypothetical protein [Theionarchaea archaeon]
MGAVAVLALPIGSLLYQFYNAIEYECFLESRKGPKEVEKILEENAFEKELNWWKGDDIKKDTKKNSKNSNRKPRDFKLQILLRQNEVLDIIYYKYEKNLADILERFFTYYHSNNVIEMYAPLLAVFAVAILDIIYLHSNALWKTGTLSAMFVFFIVLFVIVIFSIICFCLCSWLSYLKVIIILKISGIFIVILHIMTLLLLSEVKLLVIFSVPIILIMSLVKCHKNKELKKQIDELERDIVRLKKRKIIKIINEVQNKRVFINRMFWI